MMILYLDVKTAFVDLQYNLLGAFAPYVFFLVVGTAKLSSSTVYSLHNIEQFS